MLPKPSRLTVPSAWRSVKKLITSAFCQRYMVWIEPEAMLKKTCAMMKGMCLLPSMISLNIFQRSSAAIFRRTCDASLYRARTAAIASPIVARRSRRTRERGRL